MKNVFLFANFFPDNNTRGITKKIFAQIAALNELGYHVIYYTGYTKKGAAVFDSKGLIVREEKLSQGKLGRIYRNQVLKKLAYDFLKTMNVHIDIFYARWLFFDRKYLKLLKQARISADMLIVEAHSYPTYIKGSYIHYPLYFLDWLYSKKVKTYIDLVVGVSTVHNIWGIRTVNIDNGVDYIGTTVKKPSDHGSMINLISVAYEQPAHGYDRVLKGLKKYKVDNRKPPVKLLLVGTVTNSTKALIKNLELVDDVEILGVKAGKNLDEIYNRADIGIGVMAPYRAGTNDASGLKTKEYIAKGLPYIYAGKLVDRILEDSYVLQFENNDSPIDIEKVVHFYLQLDKEGMEEKIRESGKNFSWTYQLKKVIDVAESCNSN